MPSGAFVGDVLMADGEAPQCEHAEPFEEAELARECEWTDGEAG
jgi:hypothetical protein